MTTKPTYEELELKIQALEDQNKRRLRVSGFGFDLTEQKQMELARLVSSTREHFRQLVENANDTIFTLSLSGALTYISPNCKEFIGYTAEEMTDKSIGQIVHPDDIETCHEFIRDIMQSGKKSGAEYRVLHKDGGWVYHSANGSLLNSAETGERAIFCIARDITRQKQEEAGRRLKERRMQSLLKVSQYNPGSVRELLDYTLDEAIMLSDSQIGYFFRYDETRRELVLLAFSRTVMEACAIRELILPAFRLDDVGIWGEPVRTGKPIILNDYAAPHPAKHGCPAGHLPISRFMSVPVILDGRILALVGVANKADEYTEEDARQLTLMMEAIWNIAHRKEIEEELRRNRERLDIAMSVARLAAWELDMKTRVFTFDDQWFSLHHTTAEREGGHQISAATWLEKYIHPDSARKIVEAIAQMTVPDSDLLEFDLDFQGIRHNGESFDLLARICFERDEHGNVIRGHGINQDITERKRAEKEIIAAKDAAEAATRAKSTFLANMSHEIRTPMNAILGFAQLMQRDQSLTPQSREHLDIINRSGEHLLATINDILEMSKIEAGRSVFSPTTFDLPALVYDLERMFRLRTDSKNLRFLVERIGHIPRWAITDEGKLRQVLINLLGNAVKFTLEGGVVLRLGGKAKTADTVELQFEVEDTGPGMTEDEIGHLFKAFEQTKSGIKSGGTGLGLALSQGFAHIMGGDISVSSTLSKGSIFRFNTPVREDREENSPKKESKQSVQCLKSGREEIRILIVDDRETNRKLLLQLLSSVGFATNHAVNGRDAINMVGKWKPHLVLMDMAMPIMDGYEATRKIRESADIKDTAIVALTASAFEEDKQRIIDAGADGYLSKPFKDAELFEIIGRLTGAEYLYEEIGLEEKSSETADDKALMRKAIAALSPDLVSRLLNAADSADLDLLDELAGQLTTDHPTLAQRMQEMAARYEYEALIELFSTGQPFSFQKDG